MSTGGFNPLAGIGLSHPGTGPEDKVHKFTSQECLQALMDAIQNDPGLVRNQFNIVSKEESGEMQTKFWPAIFDASNWTRLATHRPTEDENGEKLYGTDREVREYENDFWADERKMLKGKVTTEFGEVIEVKVTAQW